MNKVWGTYKNGEDIYKDTKGYYIIAYNIKSKTDSKKYYKSLKKYVNNAYNKKLVRKTKKKVRKKNKKSKTINKWWLF